MTEFLAEAVVQLVLELLAQLVMCWTGGSRDPDRPPNPWLLIPGLAVLGGAAGALTLACLPAHLIQQPWLRIVYLVVAPIAVGATVAAIGKWLRRHGGRNAVINRFAFGWTFAFAFALVRHFLAE